MTGFCDLVKLMKPPKRINIHGNNLASFTKIGRLFTQNPHVTLSSTLASISMDSADNSNKQTCNVAAIDNYHRDSCSFCLYDNYELIAASKWFLHRDRSMDFFLLPATNSAKYEIMEKEALITYCQCDQIVPTKSRPISAAGGPKSDYARCDPFVD